MIIEKQRIGAHGKTTVYTLCNSIADTYDKTMIIDTIDEQPTIDAVPVVRCGECKYREKNHYCVKWGQPYLCKDDCFCPYGERRSE